MARTKRRHRRPAKTIPLGLTVPLIFPVQKAYHIYAQTGSIESGIRNWFAYYTGWTGNPARQWEPAYLKYGLAPLAIGAVAHKMASKFGVNRMIARTGIPLLRI